MLNPVIDPQMCLILLGNKRYLLHTCAPFCHGNTGLEFGALICIGN